MSLRGCSKSNEQNNLVTLCQFGPGIYTIYFRHPKLRKLFWNREGRTYLTDMWWWGSAHLPFIAWLQELFNKKAFPE